MVPNSVAYWHDTRISDPNPSSGPYPINRFRATEKRSAKALPRVRQDSLYHVEPMDIREIASNCFCVYILVGIETDNQLKALLSPLRELLY